MSFKIADAFVEVTADTSKVGSTADAGMKKQSGMFSKMGTIAGGILGAQLVTAVGGGLKKMFSTGFEEYMDADALNKQFAAGIKSTGNVANLTVEGMNNLASSIQAYSGQTDDSIGKTMSLLQTFTNIRNVGPEKIFDRATMAAADMAARMGTDASSAAVQLGKALNDPVAGIASLSRVGVQFNDQQKAQIKTLHESGNTLEAQKIILKELEMQFGGSAAAAGQSFTGTIERMKRGFEDVTQAVVGGIMPLVLPVMDLLAKGLFAAAGPAEALGEKLGEFISGIDWSPLVNGFSTVMGFITPLAQSFGTLLGPLLDVWMALSPLNMIFQVLEPLLPTIAGLVETLANALSGTLAATLPMISRLVGSLAEVFSGVLAAVLPVIVNLIEILLDALLPIMPVILGLVSVLGGVFAQVIKALLPPFVELVNMLGPILQSVLAAVMPFIGKLASFLTSVLVALMPLLDPLMSLLNALTPLIPIIIDLVMAALVPLMSAFEALMPIIQLVIDILVAVLVPAIDILAAIITWLVENVVKPMFDKFGAIVDFIVGLIVGYIKAMGAIYTWLWNSIIKPVFDFIGSAFKWLWETVIKPVSDFINSAIKVVGDTIGNVFETAAGIMKGAFNGVTGAIKGVINGVIDLINGAIGGINTMIGLINNIPGVSIPKLGRLPRLEKGGTTRTGGLAVVGEKGPEIVSLPGGATVYPTGTGPGTGSGSTTVNQTNHITIDASTIKSLNDLIALFESLTQAARQGQGTAVA